jgi:hypothetical protein
VGYFGLRKLDALLVRRNAAARRAKRARSRHGANSNAAIAAEVTASRARAAYDKGQKNYLRNNPPD